MTNEKIDKMIEILKSFKEGKKLEGKVYDKSPNNWRGIVDLDLHYKTTDGFRFYGFEDIREKPTRIPSWEELISMAEKKTLLSGKYTCDTYTIHGLLIAEDNVILSIKNTTPHLVTASVGRKELFELYVIVDSAEEGVK